MISVIAFTVLLLIAAVLGIVWLASSLGLSMGWAIGACLVAAVLVFALGGVTSMSGRS